MMSPLGQKIATTAETMVGTPFILGGFCKTKGLDCLGLWLVAASEHSPSVAKVIPHIEKATILENGGEFNPRSGITPEDFLEETLASTRSTDVGVLEGFAGTLENLDPADAEPGDFIVYSREGGLCGSNYHGAVVAKNKEEVVQASHMGVIKMRRSRMKLTEVTALRVK